MTSVFNNPSKLDDDSLMYWAKWQRRRYLALRESLLAAENDYDLFLAELQERDLMREFTKHEA